MECVILNIVSLVFLKKGVYMKTIRWSVLRITAIILCFALLSLSADAIGITSGYTISEPYAYPIVGGTEAWNQLETRADMAEACMVPEEILTEMTTHALLETVLDYPLLGELLAFNSEDQGFERICRSFNGLQELLLREDLPETLVRFSLEDSIIGETDEAYKTMHAEVMLRLIRERITASGYRQIVMPLSFTPLETTTIYTPAGTPVIAYVDSNIYLHVGIPPDAANADARIANEIAAQERYYRAMYPGATKIADYDPRCNCHSFALYGDGYVNRYWFDNPVAFYTDGSLVSVDDNYFPQYALYYNGGAEPEEETAYYMHSAIRTDVNSYYSKWGFYGVYRHNSTQNPYYEEASGISYWRLNIIYADGIIEEEIQ